MKPFKAETATSPRRERGAVLITGLILLAMVMLLGMAAMRTVTLQERLSGSSVDHNQAFQAAEAALRAGEAAIKADTKPDGYNIFNIKDDPAPAVKDLAQGYAFWSSHFPSSHRPMDYPLYGAGNTNNPKYIIELQSGEGKTGDKLLSGSLALGAAKDKLPQASVYRVTALGRGMQEESNVPVSDVVLQTTISR
ncbi:MAG: hypothetical protein LBI92_05430 [Azoarcus sp.]|nr:hypothetical protein [Azoarcus sp.]